jgi:integrase
LGLSPAPKSRKLNPEEPSPKQARNLLGYAKQIFTYAVDQHCYGLEVSPADKLKGGKLCGKKVKRTRVLQDEELRAVWEASFETEYPYGPLFRMLIMTGQRRSEVSAARWREFDFDAMLWSIPGTRMKNKMVQVVPITDDLMALLKTLPRFRAGDCLFSTGFGERPCNGFSMAKRRLDELVGPNHWQTNQQREKISLL